MNRARTDVELVQLHAALRKQAFEEAGTKIAQAMLESAAKTAAHDPEWSLVLKKHLEMP
jgi:hypothetical protein